MARQIVILCDFHLVEHDEHVPGVEKTVAFEGRGPLTAAFCDDCLKRMYEPLATFMRDNAQPAEHVPAPAPRPGRKRRAEGTFICPFGDSSAFNKRHGIATHLRDNHGTSIVDYENQHGPIEPTDDTSMLPHECPECGERLGSPQGLGAHRRSVHGTVSQKSSSDEAAVPA